MAAIITRGSQKPLFRHQLRDPLGRGPMPQNSDQDYRCTYENLSAQEAKGRRRRPLATAIFSATEAKSVSIVILHAGRHTASFSRITIAV